MFYLLAILFASAPTYVLHFNVGPFPLDLLEILVAVFLAIFAGWLLQKNLIKDFINFIRKPAKSFWILFSLFFLAGIISTIVSPDHTRALGLFLVWFLEPMLVYFPAAYILQQRENKIRFIKFILIVLGLLAAYAIIQYFTLIGLPQAWWGNSDEPKRALSIFAYPNAYALFIAPLLAFTLPEFFAKNLNWFYKACYCLALIGLLLTLSRGGWSGYAIAVCFYLAVFADSRIRKITAVIAVAIIIVIAAVPNFRYRVILPFKGDKSSVSRFSLWHTADKMIESSPILGKGLYGYKTDFDKYNTDPNLSSLDFPHNIFLNFWVETGLLGLISFAGLSIYFFHQAWKIKGLAATGIILFLIALYIHGLVDAPYMKNDLALVFWIIMATL